MRLNKSCIAVVPDIFGTRDQCSYENLTPDELRWS